MRAASSLTTDPGAAPANQSLSSAVEKCVASFGEFIEFARGTNDPGYTTRINDALFYRATCLIALREDEQAVANLRSIIDSVSEETPPIQDQIWVDHFFWGFPETQRHNQHFNSVQLAEFALDYIIENQYSAFSGELDDNKIIQRLEGYISYLDQFENRDHRVVFASLNSREAALSTLERLEARLERNEGSHIELQVLDPGVGRSWGVATQDFYTFEQAAQIRDQASEYGLGSDAWIWRPMAM